MRSAWRALAAYIVITLAATWPLARGLGRDVAWDLGDSLLNMWVLAWDAEQLLAILGGDFSRIRSFFDGNIFYPAPLTIAYAEHLFPQALQILPVYALTGNPILCYNLLFLSTFVLSGLGMYLFVRELTGNARAAFVAGLLFAFAPYRLPQSPHLQVLSAQWMPFVLYGFRRYLDSVQAGRRRLRPLAGASLALVVQNLSCGYYLLYFAPFAGAYVLWEMIARGVWRRPRLWAELTVAAALVLAMTLPFLLPYLAVAEAFEFERSRPEVIRYSADVYSYATAAADQTLWGDRIRAFPKPEGDLFLGFVAMFLAALGVAGWRYRERAAHPEPHAPAPAPRGGPESSTAAATPGGAKRWLVWLLAAGAILHLVAAAAALIYRRILLDLWMFELQISNVTQVLFRAAVFAILLLIVSPRVRDRARAFARDRGFFVAAMAAAMWLSLGPLPQVLGRPVEIAAPYGFLYEHVPGFDGVRVPARFAMIVVLMLAVLGGYGAAVLTRWRYATPLLALLSAAFLAESLVLPFTVNGVTPTPGYITPEARVYRPARAPEVYKEIARLPAESVIAELPLGESDFDLRAMFYSIGHWRPLLNGYSGFFPPHYGRLAVTLIDLVRFPDAAVEALRRQGATHVVVHEDAYPEDRGAATTAALRERGASELYRSGGDVLLELP